MSNLTEQWKKGELIEGFYYVKCPWSDEIEVRYVHNGTDEYDCIVAPVPSYKENKQLKNLLKECRDVIKDVESYCTKNADESYILIYKIDNATGEKK